MPRGTDALTARTRCAALAIAVALAFAGAGSGAARGVDPRLLTPAELDTLMATLAGPESAKRAGAAAGDPALPPAQWLRRVSLDVVGELPDAAAQARFARDLDQRRGGTSPAARARVVDALLGSVGFGARWGKLLARPLVSTLRDQQENRRRVEGYFADGLNARRSWRALIAGLLSAEGSAEESPAIGFYLPFLEARTEIAARVGSGLMGVRMACAQCHDHPFASWKMADFYGLSAYFTGLRTHGVPKELYRAYRESRRGNSWTVEVELAGGKQRDSSVKRLQRLMDTFKMLDRRAIGGTAPRRDGGSIAVERRPAPAGAPAMGAMGAQVGDALRGNDRGAGPRPGGSYAGLGASPPSPPRRMLELPRPARPARKVRKEVPPPSDESPSMMSAPKMPGPKMVNMQALVYLVTEDAGGGISVPEAIATDDLPAGLTRSLAPGARVAPRLPGVDGSRGTPGPGGSSGTGRAGLAAWLTEPANPYVARALVNRVWAHLFGTGLVEPVDGLDGPIDPAHARVLDALAGHLVASDFDVPALFRLVLASRAYQAAGRGTGDAATAAVVAVRPLDGGQATGAFTSALGLGRAEALERAVSQSFEPRAADEPSDAPSERPAADLRRALFLVTGPELAQAMSGSPTLARIAQRPPDERLDALFAQLLSRPPTDPERARLDPLVRNAAGMMDAAWAICAGAEFLTNH